MSFFLVAVIVDEALNELYWSNSDEMVNKNFKRWWLNLWWAFFKEVVIIFGDEHTLKNCSKTVTASLLDRLWLKKCGESTRSSFDQVDKLTWKGRSKIFGELKWSNCGKMFDGLTWRVVLKLLERSGWKPCVWCAYFSYLKQ